MSPELVLGSGEDHSDQMNLPKETYYGFNKQNPEHIEKLKYVLAQDGPKRWRAASDLYLYLNPKSYALNEKGELVVAMDARTEAKMIAEECAELRKGLEQVNNQMGLSKNKSGEGDAGRRYSLRMPATMLQFIQMIDPDLTETTKGEAGKRMWNKLRREFKEYQVLTVY